MARKKHSTKHPEPVMESFEEIESIAERMAQWIADHVRLVVILVAVLLVSAGGIQAVRSKTRAAANAASNALAEVRDAYLEAMGASPGSLEIPELANPTAQVGVREEFAGLFAEVAELYPGTVQAALAWLESGDLLSETGEREAAAEAWQEGLAAVPANEAVQGTLWVRIADAHEARGSWREAADAYVEAFELERYPLRFWAMADAARCFDRAGDTARALQLLERVVIDAPRLQLPEHMRARLQELRAAENLQVRSG